MFYKSVIQSVLTFSLICWFRNIRQKDKNNLQRIVNISSKVTGTKQSTLTVLYEKQVLRKAARILADIFYMRNISFSRRLDGLELLLANQIEDGYRLFLRRFDF